MRMSPVNDEEPDRVSRIRHFLIENVTSSVVTTTGRPSLSAKLHE